MPSPFWPWDGNRKVWPSESPPCAGPKWWDFKGICFAVLCSPDAVAGNIGGSTGTVAEQKPGQFAELPMNNGWNCLWRGHPVQPTDHLKPGGGAVTS